MSEICLGEINLELGFKFDCFKVYLFNFKDIRIGGS